MKNQNNLARGIILALVTSVISGVSIFYSKVSVAKIDPLILAASRNTLVGLLFVVPFLLGGGISRLRKLSPRDLVLLVLVGLVGGGIPFYLFFLGVKIAGAQSANIIHKTLFIWVAFLSGALLGEKVNLSFIAAGLLVFAGNMLLAPGRLVFGSGEQLVLAATLLWAIENILAKKVLPRVSSVTVGFFRMALGGTVLLALSFLSGKAVLFTRLGGGDITTILLGAGILFFYVATWYKALEYAPAGLVTLILTFSLVVGNVLNGAFAGVKLMAPDWISSALVASGVVLVLLANRLSSFAKKASS